MNISSLKICEHAFKGEINQVVDLLNQNLGNLVAKDKTLRCALHWAASGKQINILNLLFERGATAIKNEKDEMGWTPLMIASSVGSLECVRALLDKEADINCSNFNGQTALHYAASKNWIQIVELLVDSGADVNACDNIGSTSLHRAASKGNDEVVKVLLRMNQLEVDLIDKQGNTPLHLACEEERLASAKMLIKAGARSEILNKDKKTPLELAPPVMRSALKSLVQHYQI